MPENFIQLGVNVDHVATIRQARYREVPDSPNAEPDPVAAALAAEKGGATGITAHLRADRRHVQDRDIQRLKETITTKLNFEMGNDDEIVGIALELRPADACLVPENREEVTTEGGLNCLRGAGLLRETIERLHEVGTRVSLFIDPDRDQIDAALRLEVECVELHTGAFANATGVVRELEFERLKVATKHALDGGLIVNAGHGINYQNVADIRKIPGLTELNIGHSIVSRSTVVGMERATAEMLAAMRGEALEDGESV
ncbi:MAG: pyridoxine 5'-phosphate synthase [Chthoniobacterales bacterium]